MKRMSKRRVQSLIDSLLMVAIVLALSLLVLWGYKGREEQSGRYYRYESGGAPFIANITVNLGGIPKHEHCRTCHPDGRTAVRIDSSLPGRSHPNIAPHSMFDLGCTSCHLGEGMAADLKISHGRIGNEALKVLAGEDLQASCYQCHELKPLKGAEMAWEGFQLFSENACNTCHTIGGLKGSSYGPDLSDAGTFLGINQIKTAIENPKANLESSIMPKFSLTPEEVKALTYFLKSRIKAPYYETPMIRLWKNRDQERLQGKRASRAVRPGNVLLKEKECLACHKYGGTDGQIGPDLTFTAFMRSRIYIRDFLQSPGNEIPGAIMPRIALVQGEEEGLIQILLRKGDFYHLKSSPRMAYMMLCQRCHAAQGDGFGIIEPNLANFPRAFRNNEPFFKSIPDSRILSSISKGIPGTSMPPYDELLRQETINPLVDLLFRFFIRGERLNKAINTPPPKPERLPSSEEILSTFRKKCSLCHGLQGKGKGPDYLKYLPRPRDLTNYPYFKSLPDERIALAIAYGVPGTAMRPFLEKIRPEATWGLVSLIRKFSSKEGINDD